MRGSKCQSTVLVPFRGKMLFIPCPQDRILVPCRGSFQNFRQSPPSLLYGIPPPPPLRPSVMSSVSVDEILLHYKTHSEKCVQ